MLVSYSGDTAVRSVFYGNLDISSYHVLGFVLNVILKVVIIYKSHRISFS